MLLKTKSLREDRDDEEDRYAKGQGDLKTQKGRTFAKEHCQINWLRKETVSEVLSCEEKVSHTPQT